MKENGIMVDYEWAYKKVVLSHDMTGKDPAWVNSFVEGWRKGYLKGFLRGWTEGTIEVLCRMKRTGMTADKIAEYTNLSRDVVEMIDIVDESTT
jgi:hypothetical protein